MLILVIYITLLLQLHQLAVHTWQGRVMIFELFAQLRDVDESHQAGASFRRIFAKNDFHQKQLLIIYL